MDAILKQEEAMMTKNLTADGKKQAVTETVEKNILVEKIGEAIQQQVSETIAKVVTETIDDLVGKQKQIETALSQPREVTIKGRPKVDVTFPDDQKVNGEVNVRNLASLAKAIVSALPMVQKIKGTVIAQIDGPVDAKVQFPKVQTVKFDSEPKVTITNPLDPEDLQTRLTRAFAAVFPVAKGVNPKKETANPSVYLPVRLTNGRTFYDVMTTMVQSNGKINALLEQLLSQTNKNATSWTALVADVTAAGTGQQVPALAIPDGFGLLIKAKETNTGLIYLGNSKAASEAAASRFTLTAGAFRTLKITNANLVWINSSVSAEGVEYSVERMV